jgi:hypothetical protein
VPRRFSAAHLGWLRASKILGVRAGTEHRFTGVWVVVVQNHVFVRSWDNKPDGWYQTFTKNPFGAIQVSGLEIPVRARKVRGERLIDAIDLAYAEKYNTPASKKYVRGFALPKRRQTIVELMPAGK